MNVSNALENKHLSSVERTFLDGRMSVVPCRVVAANVADVAEVITHTNHLVPFGSSPG